MKNIFAMLLVFSMLLGFTAAMAQDLGVQLIGGDNSGMETLNLDDVQIGQTYEIGGYARITPVEYKVVDMFPAFETGSVGDSTTNKSCDWGPSADAGLVFYGYDYCPLFYEKILWQNSGKNADFAWLQLDITNLQKQPVDFMAEMSVKGIYLDEYEYKGWVRQLNYDYDLTRKKSGGNEEDYGPADYGTLIRAAISPDDAEEIDMVYTGHYIIGCTLPNAVFEDKNGSLRIIVEIGGNEITYNIRK